MISAILPAMPPSSPTVVEAIVAGDPAGRLWPLRRRHDRPGRLPSAIPAALVAALIALVGIAGPAAADRPGVVYPFRSPEIDSVPVLGSDTAAATREFRPGRALVAGRITHQEWDGGRDTFVSIPVHRVIAAVIDRSGAAMRRIAVTPDSDGLFVLPRTIAGRGETITIAEWSTESRVVRRTASDRLFAAVSGSFPTTLYGFVWMGDITFLARETDAVFGVSRPLPGLFWSWRLDSRPMNPAYRVQTVRASHVVPYSWLAHRTDSRWAEVLHHLSGDGLNPGSRSRVLTPEQVRAYRVLRDQEQAADSGIVRSLRQTLRVLATLGDGDNHNALATLARGAEFVAQTFSIFHAIFQADGPPGRRPSPPSRADPR